LIRSYRAYTTTELGFRERGIIAATIKLPEYRYDTTATRIAFYDQLQARLRALPGVINVGAAAGIPLSGWDIQGEVHVFGRGTPRPNEEIISHYQLVYPSFFSVMEIPLVRGRMLTDMDRDSISPTIVVNETFARRVFPGDDPIGKRVSFGGPNTG